MSENPVTSALLLLNREVEQLQKELRLRTLSYDTLSESMSALRTALGVSSSLACSAVVEEVKKREKLRGRESVTVDAIRRELGVPYDFPHESLPSMIATIRDCRHNTCASALTECESLTKRITELEKQNSIMRDTVRSCSEARCKAEAEARMSTEHAANYHTQLHNIRCAMEAKGFPPNIDIASFIRERLVCKES